MVVLYYNVSNCSCRKAKRWFRANGIEIEEKRIDYISKKDLIYALSLSEKGFSDLLKRTTQCDAHMKEMIENIICMSFNDGVDLLLENPHLIKVPLMLDKHKLVIGYNSEEIRVFVPSQHRFS